jgi:hypothetical protein
MLILRTTEHEQYDLPDGASIDVTGSNPAFDKDVVARFFSFPFALPATPRNLRLLRHANRLDGTRRSPDTDVEMWLAGSSLQEGRLRVSNATATRLECVFGNRDRELLDRLQEVKIRDLMPTVTLDAITVAVWQLPGPFDSVFISGKIIITLHGDVPTAVDNPPVGVFLEPPVYDPVLNVTTWVSEWPLFPEIVSMTIHGVQVWHDYTGVPGADAGPLFALLLNIALNGQENVHRYTDEAADDPTGPFGFPILYHSGLYGDSNPEFSRYVNFWRDGAFVFNLPEEERIWRATFVPYARHKWIFEAIGETMGLFWAGEFWDDPDFAQAMLFSNYTLDNVQELTVGGEPRLINALSTEWWGGNTVPDWTAAEYVKRVCAFFNIYIQQRGSTLLLRRRKDQLRVTENFPYILTDFKVTRLPESGVTLAFQPDDNDELATLPNYVIGGGGKRIETELSPLNDMEIFYGPGRTWRMCAYFDRNGRPGSGESPSSAAPRIFFDRGLQVDTNDDQYRMSSHLDTDTNGDPIGELRLTWEGDTGLYTTLWKGWAELEDKEPLEMEAVIPVGEIRRMLRWERPVIRFYHALGEVRAIVRNIQFDASVDDAEMFRVTLEMLKI